MPPGLCALSASLGDVEGTALSTSLASEGDLRVPPWPETVIVDKDGVLFGTERLRRDESSSPPRKAGTRLPPRCSVTSSVYRQLPLEILVLLPARSERSGLGPIVLKNSKIGSGDETRQIEIRW